MIQNDADGRRAADIFFESVRRAFSHDLRTPLGGIVNYAAALEAKPTGTPDELSGLARRIRASALRASRMVDLLANSIALAIHPPRRAATDLVALARTLLVEGGGRSVTVAATAPSISVEVDADVLAFAWRAFIAVEADASGQPMESATVTAVADSEQRVIELSTTVQPPSHAFTPVQLDEFLRGNAGPGRIETALGMTLTQQVLTRHGGAMTTFGRAGAGATLRVRWPH